MDYTDRIPNQEYQTELGAMLARLAEARQHFDKVKSTVTAIREVFENSPAWKLAKSELEEAGSELDKFDAMVRSTALTTKEALPKEIVVKTFKEVIIPKSEDARQWCFDNMKPALVLDKKIFSDIVKKGLVPQEIAHVEEEKRAQIAQDLSKYLEV